MLKVNFGRKLGGMLWMSLWVFLWACLFIIPGIIKGLAYSMTPYILASSPNVKATDALKLSKRMTDGFKGDIFIMHLSFIGWHILDSFTYGILGIFYVTPYMNTALAGLFVELRGYAVASGSIHPSELDGAPPYSPYHQQNQQAPAFAPDSQYPQAYSQHPQYPGVQLHTPYPPQQPLQDPYVQPPPMPQDPFGQPPPMPQDPYSQPLSPPQYIEPPQQPAIPQAPALPDLPQQPDLPQPPAPPEPPPPDNTENTSE